MLIKSNKNLLHKLQDVQERIDTSPSFANQTISLNSLHISDQIRKAKQDAVSGQISSKSSKHSPQTSFDLSEFIRQAKLQQLAQQKFSNDQRFAKLQINKVRDDVSHFYDSSKQSKTTRIQRQLQGTSSVHSRKKLKQIHLIDMNEYKRLSQQLNKDIKSLHTDDIGGRVQSIRLKEWFQQQNQSQNDLIPLLSVTMNELIKQLKRDCVDRGNLVEEVWDKIIEMINQTKFEAELNIKRNEVQVIDEQNRIYFIYQDEMKQLKSNIEIITQKYNQQTNDYAQLKNEYIEIENNFKKNRSQLNDMRKIANFLQKKVKSQFQEIEILNRKLQTLHLKKSENSKFQRQETMLSQQISQQQKDNIKEDNQQQQINIQSLQNSLHNSQFHSPNQQLLQQLVGQQQQQQETSRRSYFGNSQNTGNTQQDKSSSSEDDDLMDGLLDDKNIIEMDNMVMNMDKIIKVAFVETQVEQDLLQQYQKTQEIQTTLNLINKDFNIIADSQIKIQNVLEQFKQRQAIEDTLKFYEDKSSKFYTRQLNQIIEQKFAIKEAQSPGLFNQLINGTNNNKLAQLKAQDSFRSRKTVVVNSSIDAQSSNNDQSIDLSSDKIDLEKVKALLIMMQSLENKNKELQYIIDQMTENCKLHTKELDETRQRAVSIRTFQLLQEQQQQTQTQQNIESQSSMEQQFKSSQKIIKRQKDQKKLNQAKLIFKGPQLGQKVAVIYEFQKGNIGQQLVEKIKLKQLPKIKHFMPLKLLLKQITVIYQDRIQQQKDNQASKDQDMASFVYSYFLSQFGIKKIAEQKFLILIVSVKHYKTIVRINNFAKFLGLFDNCVNYSIDEMKKYLEAFDYVTNISILGNTIPDQESEVRFFVPYVRAQQYIGMFADSRMTLEEKEELKRELDLLKETDQKQTNRQQIIDFDQFMIQMFVKYKILVSRAKEYVINAFAACDLDGNGMCNFEEWYLLLRHIEPDRLSNDEISEIFFANADLLIKGEQNFSFEKFAVVCVEYGLFSEEAQNLFLQMKGTKTEIMVQFQKLLETWSVQRKIIEQRFEQITLLETEKIDSWRQIIETLENKIFDLREHLTQTGIEKKVKPLLIANLLLNKESQMLLDLQEDYDEEGTQKSKSQQFISSASIQLQMDAIKE